MGVLVAAQRRMHEDAQLAIVCTHPQVLSVFEITGMDEAFKIHPDRTAALEHVQGTLRIPKGPHVPRPCRRGVEVGYDDAPARASGTPELVVDATKFENMTDDEPTPNHVEPVIADGQRPDIRHRQPQLGSPVLATPHHLGDQIDTDRAPGALGTGRLQPTSRAAADVKEGSACKWRGQLVDRRLVQHGRGVFDVVGRGPESIALPRRERPCGGAAHVPVSVAGRRCP